VKVPSLQAEALEQINLVRGGDRRAMRGKCGAQTNQPDNLLGRGEREINLRLARALFPSKTQANSLLPVRPEECGGFMWVRQAGSCQLKPARLTFRPSV